MKSSTREWMRQAEEDYEAALDLARRRKRPLDKQVCFHAQQCVEKYLKARLNEASIGFARNHDLEQLLAQAMAVEPLWSSFQPVLKKLNEYAVQPRYPGFPVTKAEAKQAVKDCKSFRKEARLSLGLRT